MQPVQLGEGRRRWGHIVVVFGGCEPKRKKIVRESAKKRDSLMQVEWRLGRCNDIIVVGGFFVFVFFDRVVVGYNEMVVV